jgi:hypothetical protein
LWKKEKISLGTNVHENKKKKQSTKIRQKKKKKNKKNPHSFMLPIKQ